MTTLATSKKTKASAKSRLVLGRSAATGQVVLRPASKQGAVSLRMAKAAVARLMASKQT
jgi:hypothetical protein